MIEERAVIRAVGDGVAWVEGGAQGCERCAAGQGCGGGLLVRLMQRGTVLVPATLTEGEYRCGERVIVGIEERPLLLAAMRVYLVPLILMLLAAGTAEALLGLDEPLVALAAMLGLATGFLGLRLHAGRVELAGRYRPIVLRRDPDSIGPCARL